VEVRLFFRERAACELDVVAVEEAVGDVGGLVGLAGELGIAGDVDAPERDLAPVAVSKFAVLDGKPESRHFAETASPFVGEPWRSSACELGTARGAMVG
jgi:hypothetical protein